MAPPTLGETISLLGGGTFRDHPGLDGRQGDGAIRGFAGRLTNSFLISVDKLSIGSWPRALSAGNKGQLTGGKS